MLSLSLLVFSLVASDAFASSIPHLSASTSLESRATLGPDCEMTIVNGYVAPDGFNRSAILVNGVYPPPLISAQKGDHFSILVSNQLTDDTMDIETSIHWHGIFQHGSNFADGASWVTQCPINQTDSFLYEFDVGSQSGTYWYHSHYATQYCDGLRGPLVLYDPLDPLQELYDVDDENTVITLSDWYHTSALQLGAILGAVIPDSTLINGLGRYGDGPAAPLAVINVQSGLRYRFRVVSISCESQFNFTIDGHQLTIIEVDGNEVTPVQVDSLPVLAGQRYSVVVKADQPVGNYWIRASPDGNFTGGMNSAILRYNWAPIEDPTSEPGPYELAFDEGDLHPLIDPSAPGIPGIGNADVNIVLTPGLNTETSLFDMNNVSFVDPPIPVLLQILSGNLHPAQLLPSGSVYELPPNKVVEISVPNINGPPGGPHPIHMHGHAFSVVRHAGSDATNFVNPVRRDVTSMGTELTDNLTIRFVTDNPGPWFLHCHIDWHLHHGFAVVFAEAPAEVSTEQVPADWRDLCGAGSWDNNYN